MGYSDEEYEAIDEFGPFPTAITSSYEQQIQSSMPPQGTNDIHNSIIRGNNHHHHHHHQHHVIDNNNNAIDEGASSAGEGMAMVMKYGSSNESGQLLARELLARELQARELLAREMGSQNELSQDRNMLRKRGSKSRKSSMAGNRSYSQHNHNNSNNNNILETSSTSLDGGGSTVSRSRWEPDPSENFQHESASLPAEFLYFKFEQIVERWVNQKADSIMSLERRRPKLMNRPPRTITTIANAIIPDNLGIPRFMQSANMSITRSIHVEIDETTFASTPTMETQSVTTTAKQRAQKLNQGKPMTIKTKFPPNRNTPVRNNNNKPSTAPVMKKKPITTTGPPRNSRSTPVKAGGAIPANNNRKNNTVGNSSTPLKRNGPQTRTALNTPNRTPQQRQQQQQRSSPQVANRKAANNNIRSRPSPLHKMTESQLRKQRQTIPPNRNTKPPVRTTRSTLKASQEKSKTSITSNTKTKKMAATSPETRSPHDTTEVGDEDHYLRRDQPSHDDGILSPRSRLQVASDTSPSKPDPEGPTPSTRPDPEGDTLSQQRKRVMRSPSPASRTMSASGRSASAPLRRPSPIPRSPSPHLRSASPQPRVAAHLRSSSPQPRVAAHLRTPSPQPKPTESSPGELESPVPQQGESDFQGSPQVPQSGSSKQMPEKDSNRRNQPATPRIPPNRKALPRVAQTRQPGSPARASPARASPATRKPQAGRATTNSKRNSITTGDNNSSPERVRSPSRKPPVPSFATPTRTGASGNTRTKARNSTTARPDQRNKASPRKSFTRTPSPPEPPKPTTRRRKSRLPPLPSFRNNGAKTTESPQRPASPPKKAPSPSKAPPSPSPKKKSQDQAAASSPLSSTKSTSPRGAARRPSSFMAPTAASLASPKDPPKRKPKSPTGRTTGITPRYLASTSNSTGKQDPPSPRSQGRQQRRISRMQNRSAILLQSYWRMLPDRRRFLRLRSAVVSLQSLLRRRLQVRAFKQAIKGTRLQNFSCLVIQRNFRMASCQSSYIQLRDTVIIVQSAVRMFSCRSAYRELQSASQKLLGRSSLRSPPSTPVATSSATMNVARATVKGGRLRIYSALLIQSLVRMRWVRVAFLELRISAIALQRWYRKMTAIRDARMRAALAAAIMVQRWSRMLSMRKCFLDLRKSVVLLQSCTRMALARKSYLEIKQDLLEQGAAVMIQNLYRRNTCQLAYYQLQTSAHLIQRWIRANIARIVYGRSLRAVLVLQCWARRTNSERFVRAGLRIQRAAIVLQCWARQKSSERFVLHTICAKLIQACFRGFNDYQKYVKQRICATMIQASVRGTIAQVRYILLRFAAIDVQKRVRSHRSRARVAKLQMEHLIATTQRALSIRIPLDPSTDDDEPVFSPGGIVRKDSHLELRRLIEHNQDQCHGPDPDEIRSDLQNLKRHPDPDPGHSQTPTFEGALVPANGTLDLQKHPDPIESHHGFEVRFDDSPSPQSTSTPSESGATVMPNDTPTESDDESQGPSVTSTLSSNHKSDEIFETPTIVTDHLSSQLLSKPNARSAQPEKNADHDDDDESSRSTDGVQHLQRYDDVVSAALAFVSQSPSNASRKNKATALSSPRNSTKDPATRHDDDLELDGAQPDQPTPSGPLQEQSLENNRKRQPLPEHHRRNHHLRLNYRSKGSEQQGALLEPNGDNMSRQPPTRPESPSQQQETLTPASATAPVPAPEHEEEPEFPVYTGPNPKTGLLPGSRDLSSISAPNFSYIGLQTNANARYMPPPPVASTSPTYRLSRRSQDLSSLTGAEFSQGRVGLQTNYVAPPPVGRHQGHSPSFKGSPVPPYQGRGATLPAPQGLPNTLVPAPPEMISRLSPIETSPSQQPLFFISNGSGEGPTGSPQLYALQPVTDIPLHHQSQNLHLHYQQGAQQQPRLRPRTQEPPKTDFDSGNDWSTKKGRKISILETLKRERKRKSAPKHDSRFFPNKYPSIPSITDNPSFYMPKKDLNSQGTKENDPDEEENLTLIPSRQQSISRHANSYENQTRDLGGSSNLISPSSNPLKQMVQNKNSEIMYSRMSPTRDEDKHQKTYVEGTGSTSTGSPLKQMIHNKHSDTMHPRMNPTRDEERTQKINIDGSSNVAPVPSGNPLKQVVVQNRNLDIMFPRVKKENDSSDRAIFDKLAAIKQKSRARKVQKWTQRTQKRNKPPLPPVTPPSREKEGHAAARARDTETKRDFLNVAVQQWAKQTIQRRKLLSVFTTGIDGDFATQIQSAWRTHRDQIVLAGLLLQTWSVSCDFAPETISTDRIARQTAHILALDAAFCNVGYHWHEGLVLVKNGLVMVQWKGLVPINFSDHEFPADDTYCNVSVHCTANENYILDTWSEAKKKSLLVKASIEKYCDDQRQKLRRSSMFERSLSRRRAENESEHQPEHEPVREPSNKAEPEYEAEREYGEPQYEAPEREPEYEAEREYGEPQYEAEREPEYEPAHQPAQHYEPEHERPEHVHEHEPDYDTEHEHEHEPAHEHEHEHEHEPEYEPQPGPVPNELNQRPRNYFREEISRRYRAATLIQSAVRDYLGRREIEDGPFLGVPNDFHERMRVYSAVLIQSWYRMCVCRSMYQGLRRIQSTILLRIERDDIETIRFHRFTEKHRCETIIEEGFECTTNGSNDESAV
ncbi:microcephaly associated (Drosophila) [Seminavis robusta]|uniref:Microcephaly associated (Drosophila) n=1 Tax=Seminavis robusta TaxID=568900 RepID=A0A9N8DBI7_9STRA|nr:microcephaly associated (Drosophila) [Seminavis robusta]|eukprot:Sro25_g016730.1 microcephaly associated (Drosophila) (2631) ;mRNA; f:13082-20974